MNNNNNNDNNNHNNNYTRERWCHRPINARRVRVNTIGLRYNNGNLTPG